MVSGAGATVPDTRAITINPERDIRVIPPDLTYRPLEILPIETPPVSRDIHRPIDASPMIVPGVLSTFVGSQRGRVGDTRILAITK